MGEKTDKKNTPSYSELEEEELLEKHALSEEVRRRTKSAETDPFVIPKRLSTGDFNTAIVQFYRGEVARSNTWRTRLDTTTNWAVLTAGATLSFVFSSPESPHFAIPLNTILVAIFMIMEARRYRYYDVWARRVRVIEAGYFAPMLSSRAIPPDRRWADHISSDLLNPQFNITHREAIGRRLRANYFAIFVLLAAAWGLKVYIHPVPARDFAEFLARSRVGLVPGWIVIGVGIAFNAIVVAFAFGTLGMDDSSSEVRSHEDAEWHPLQGVSRNLRVRNRARSIKKKREEKIAKQNNRRGDADGNAK
ncbi:MAG: DUF2270 domain-containing protein [Pyrinomonadaceae bacterium]